MNEDNRRQKMLDWLDKHIEYAGKKESRIYKATGLTFKRVKDRYLELFPPVDPEAIQKVIEKVLLDYSEDGANLEEAGEYCIGFNVDKIAQQITAALAKGTGE